ncbi:MAG: hypothetical protein OEW08_14125, partial [Gammaproteobacteria bacterium]|nr:hypothetical protein [Gammaproteobacteria bacterium]
MNHLQAALLWLVDTFNSVWPMALAAFAGASAALAYQGIRDQRQRVQRHIEDIGVVLAIQRLQMQALSRAHNQIFKPRVEGRKRNNPLPTGWTLRLPVLDHARITTAFETVPELLNELLMWQHRLAEIGALCARRIQLEIALEGQGEAEGDLSRQLEKALKTLTEQIAEQIGQGVSEGEAIVARVATFWEERRRVQPRSGEEILPWGFVAVAAVLSGTFFFSEWAIGDQSLPAAGVDLQTLSSVLFASSLYASLAFCCADLVFMVRAVVKKERTLAIYFAAFTLGVLPLTYLLWLQASVI